MRNSWFLLGAFVVAYVLAAECGHWLSFQEKQFAAFWPPSGLFLFALIRTPYRRWPWVLAAALLANEISKVLFHGIPLSMSLGFWIANSVDACLGAFLFRRFAGTRTDLADMRQLTALVFTGVVVAPACSALIGTITIKLADPAASFSLLWFTWWLSTSFGVLAITPVLLTMASEYTSERNISQWRRLAEIFGIFGSIITIGIVAFSKPQGIFEAVPVRPFVLFMLLVWAGIRFSLRGAAVGALLLIMIAVWHTTRGIGPFAGTHEFFHMAKLLQFFMLGCFLTALPLGVAVESRRRMAKMLTAKAKALQAALDEIKTLRGILPICAHCKKIRTEDGEWEHVERYLKKRSIADFTHGICPSCAGQHWMEIGAPDEG